MEYNIHFQTRVVNATMRLHFFFRISNLFIENFVEVMRHTYTSNEYSRSDLSDMNIANMTLGNHMTNIRDNIVDILWANQNIFH